MTSQRPVSHLHSEAALADLLRGPTEELIEDLLDASPDGVAILSSTGEILVVNEPLLEMYRTSIGSLIGEPSSVLISERFQSPELWAAHLADLEPHELGREHELCGARSDGSEFPIELRLTPLRSSQNALVRATIRDASDRRREDIALRDAYAREQEATHQLRELDRMKAEFISTASHELRTPLTVVMGFARMLDGRWDTLDDATRLHLVKRIAASGQRLEGLIADMIDFTRAEAGRIDVTLEEHPLDELVHDAAFKFGPLLDGHQLRIDVPTGIVVLVDRAVTRRILENLLTNAMRFAPAGARIAIEAHAPAVSDTITVHVVDDGPGIPEDERDRVFERYYRAAEHVGAGQGTGIGLAITKAFVEAQGGTIWVGAGTDCGHEAGTGSCFCFTLQRAVAP